MQITAMLILYKRINLNDTKMALSSSEENTVLHSIIIIMYLYLAQYIHILQDSKRYLTKMCAWLVLNPDNVGFDHFHLKCI